MKASTYFTLVLLACLGCATAQKLTTTAEKTEAACQRALTMLRADHADGGTCEGAKAHVHAAEPECQLQFKCPSVELDGGAE